MFDSRRHPLQFVEAFPTVKPKALPMATASDIEPTSQTAAAAAASATAYTEPIAQTAAAETAPENEPTARLEKESTGRRLLYTSTSPRD